MYNADSEAHKNYTTRAYIVAFRVLTMFFFLRCLEITRIKTKI